MASTSQTFKQIIFRNSTPTAQLCLKISQQLAVLEKVRSVLPSHLAHHALHCVLISNKLTIYTDSATWASQLRFHAIAIQEKIDAVLPVPVKMIQIKIITTLDFEASKPNQKITIPSQTVIDEIRNQSRLATDSHIKHAYTKLGDTLERLKKIKWPS